MTRSLLSFPCEGNILAGTLDRADQPGIGLLIVSGGMEIRSGAHNGMAQLAENLRRQGITCLRYDRRGVGDSGGVDPGFEGSAPDIAAATTALRTACPDLRQIYAMGNCDAAAALILHHQKLDLAGLLLTNIWIIDSGLAEGTPVPPPATAIRARYLRKLSSRAGWKQILSVSINYRIILSSIISSAKSPASHDPTSLRARLASALTACPVPVHILLAKGDNTAATFAEAWHSPCFSDARKNRHIRLQILKTSSHSFVGKDNQRALTEFCLNAMKDD